MIKEDGFIVEIIEKKGSVRKAAKTRAIPNTLLTLEKFAAARCRAMLDAERKEKIKFVKRQILFQDLPLKPFKGLYPRMYAYYWAADRAYYEGVPIEYIEQKTNLAKPEFFANIKITIEIPEWADQVGFLMLQLNDIPPTGIIEKIDWIDDYLHKMVFAEINPDGTTVIIED